MRVFGKMPLSTFQLDTSIRHHSISASSRAPTEIPWSPTPTPGPLSTLPTAPSEPQIDPRITDPNDPINSVERHTPAVQLDNKAPRISPRKNKGKRKATTPPATVETEQSTGPKKRAPKIKLGPKEDLALVQFCLKYADTYGRSKSDVHWWKNVGNKFNTWLHKPFTNHKRHMKDLVKARKLFLEMLQTGDEDETGPFVDAITQWITLVDSFEDEEANKKKSQQVIDAEDERASQLRANMSKTLSQKKRDRPEISQSDSSSDDSGFSTSERRPDRSSYNISPPLAISETPIPVDRRIHDINRQSTSTLSSSHSVSSSSARKASRSSRDRSSTPRLTAAKRARLQAEANQSSVARLAEVLANRFEGGESNTEVNRKLKKVEEELEEAKKARQLQDDKMDRILAAIGALTAAQSS